MLRTQNAALTPHNVMLRTQNAALTPHNAMLRTQNAALTPHNAMLRTQNAALTPHNTMLRTQNAALTPQNTALTPQNAVLRTQLSHPKLKHFVSKILYKNKLRLKVLDLRALKFAEERSQCLQVPVRNQRAGGPPGRSSRSLLWPVPVTGDSPCPQRRSRKRKPGDTQCPQFLGQMYLRVLILLTVCSETLVFLSSFDFVMHCSDSVLAADHA